MKALLQNCAVMALLLAAGACHPRADKPGAGNDASGRPSNDAVPAPPVSNEGAAGTVAAAPLPLHERDAAGAGRVVERAIALATSGQIETARQLVRPGPDVDERIAQAQKAYAAHPDARVVVTGPGISEGAAGSIYMEVPVAVSYDGANGQEIRRNGTVTLRRANDVPGATEEQLSWRIVDAKLDPPPR